MSKWLTLTVTLDITLSLTLTLRKHAHSDFTGCRNSLPQMTRKEKNTRPNIDCYAEYGCRSSRGRSIYAR